MNANTADVKLVGDEWYPYYELGWNVKDQEWSCNLVNRYHVPLSVIHPIYRYIIEQGKCNTFQEEYQRYLEFLAEHGIDTLPPK